MVLFLNFMTGMHQAIGPLSVVGQKEQALRVVIETTHRIDAIRHIFEQVGDKRASLTVFQCGDITGWLVEQNVETLCVDLQWFSINCYAVY